MTTHSGRDRLDALVERLRASARRDLTESDDGEGALADPLPHSHAYGEGALGPEPTPVAVAAPRDVPYGVDLAAAWSWRLLAVAAAGVLVYLVLSFFSEITVPLAIGVLITALAIPFVDMLERIMPRSLAALIVVIGGIALVVGMLTLAGQQVATQFDTLRTQLVQGIEEIQDWARTGPLNLTDDQLASTIERGKDAIAGQSSSQVVGQITEVGTTVTHVLAGFFIALFATYFFLYEGERIWGWVVRIAPRRARPRVDSSGRAAWVSLTAFVRATVVVALVDAIGIAVVAWILGVPLTLAIATLVFLGAFVPIIGAFVSGLVAVLVALVAQGPWTAVFMLVGVIAVQQVEAHILQPFLMGRLVAVHPLVIIIAIAAGVAVSGIVGALVAVPMAASLGAVVRHLSQTSAPGSLEPADASGAGPPGSDSPLAASPEPTTETPDDGRPEPT